MDNNIFVLAEFHELISVDQNVFLAGHNTNCATYGAHILNPTWGQQKQMQPYISHILGCFGQLSYNGYLLHASMEWYY